MAARDATFTWTPSPGQLERANVVRLAQTLGCSDYAALHRLSVEEPDRFWRSVVDDLELQLASPWRRVRDDSRGIEWTTWFEGARLNVATACVHAWAERTPDAVAAIFCGEDRTRDEWTFAELSLHVAKLAQGLADLGVAAGDRIAVYLPMCPEAAIASYACAHLGAIQVPIFSGFGATAVAQRLQDSGAKVVITADWSYRRGKRTPMRETIEDALREAPSVEYVAEWRREDRTWSVPLGDGSLPALEVAAEQPLLLAYTSGTTGRPKGALHVHGGFLLSIAREAAYQSDIQAGDRVLFATDMGWIMGPWTVVGTGALGAAVVYMEGAPDWPDDRLWRLVEEERVTMLGVSPTLIRALIPKGEPTADLSSLRAITTTGEPWNAGPYDWLDEHAAGNGRIPIVNISGGTEVGACFLSVTPMAPTKPCSLGFPALGQAMDVYSPAGEPLRGEVGELVCTRAWPGMTRGIWGDDARYLETYWSRFPGVWTHGDWASVDEDGYWSLHGRSDDTLNIAGKRIGPAELESAALDHPGVAEAAAVGIPHEVKGEVAWLFCALKPGAEAEADAVRAVVAAALGKAFAPERVLFVSALPKTRSAKIVRRAVRATALGKDPGDLSTLENPDALKEIANVV
ncbi:MAG: AMP-binding protein [Gaiellaceae bacterium MAG52_C11]|nr:AMP-binding protein [Candidatus Gaiellasilicea maunaloa]